MTTEELYTLISDVNTILKKDMIEVLRQINAFNAYCYSVRSWRDESGNTGVTIYISKVSPDVHVTFYNQLTANLERLNYSNFEIRTEW